MESLSSLSGRVAHDFNNILGVIVNYATFVVEEAEAETPDLKALAEDAKQILAAGGRGTDLTRELLLFARRASPPLQPLDLNTLVSEAGLPCPLDLAPDLSPVMWDRGQAGEVVRRLTAEPVGPMTLGTANVGNFASLWVKDSGRSLTAEELSSAFEPFADKGHGIGLAMVWSMVAGAGGDVEIESSPGAGTTVTVLLPA